MQLATYRTELAARLRAVTDDIAWIARAAHIRPQQRLIEPIAALGPRRGLANCSR